MLSTVCYGCEEGAGQVLPASLPHHSQTFVCGKVDWKGTLSGIVGIMGLFSQLISLLANKIEQL